MGVCVRCGKRSSIIDKHGHCEKCHNELFVARMKEMAGDTSPDVGILYEKRGLFRKPVCRVCGQEKLLKEIDVRTGYCKDCTEKLKAKYREKNKPQEDLLSLRVSGTSFRQDSFEAFAEEDDDYLIDKKEVLEADRVDDPLYRYYFPTLRAELVPEPENPEDPRAISVCVRGVKLGYIPANAIDQVEKLIAENRIKMVNADLYGGPYKILEEVDDEKYEMKRVDENNFGASVRIRYDARP